MNKTDREEINELLEKIGECCHGYRHSVVALACSRMIGVALTRGAPKTREMFLDGLPDYLRAMLKQMDEIVQ